MIPRLHVLVGDDELGRPGGTATARLLLERLGPGVAVHLRARVTARRLAEVARDLAPAAAAGGGWCVVNGRLDVALAADAQAVQLGRDAIDVADARALIERLGRPLRVGVSVHGVAESLGAAERGAQHLVLGTIFSTPTHPGRPGSGTALIREARDRLDRSGWSEVPLLVIGGLGPERVVQALEAGAHGIVVRRAVWSDDDPLAAAGALVERLEAATHG